MLQELLCTSVFGGKLDFPRHASFAAVKLVIWWEEEYVAAYRKSSGLFRTSNELEIDEEDLGGGCGGIVKASDPNKFVNLITKSAEQLLSKYHSIDAIMYELINSDRGQSIQLQHHLFILNL